MRLSGINCKLGLTGGKGFAVKPERYLGRIGLRRPTARRYWPVSEIGGPRCCARRAVEKAEARRCCMRSLGGGGVPGAGGVGSARLWHQIYAHSPGIVSGCWSGSGITGGARRGGAERHGGHVVSGLSAGLACRGGGSAAAKGTAVTTAATGCRITIFTSQARSHAGAYSKMGPPRPCSGLTRAIWRDRGLLGRAVPAEVAMRLRWRRPLVVRAVPEEIAVHFRREEA